MINIEATIRWKGYDPRDLKPKSHKIVWAVCNDCNKGRWVKFQDYRDLCLLCKRQELKQKYLSKNNPHWKGGKRLRIARMNAKRKQFGFIPINSPQENSEGHHLDFEYILFIPENLHKSIYHSNIKNINMDIINNLAEEWYLKDQDVI